MSQTQGQARGADLPVAASAPSGTVPMPSLAEVSATSAAPTLEAMSRPLLVWLQRMTGLDSTYLTEIDLAADEQRILFSVNRGGLEIPEGLSVTWSDTLCRRALAGEPAVTDEVPVVYPDSAAARALGLQTYVSVPVALPTGQVYGTLCGASAARRLPAENVLGVMRFFAQLIADRVARDRELESERARSAELTAFTQRIVALERTKSEFLRIAGHELRNPLTVLSGYLQMAQGGGFGACTDELTEVFGELLDKVDVMDSLIGQMLDTARLEDDRLDLRFVDIDLRAIVERAAASARPMLREGHLLTVTLPDDPIPVRVDEGRIGIVVGNLLSNAVKYSPRGGEVSCTLTAVAGGAELTVVDDGVGVAPEHAEQLFTRFGRIEDAAHAGIPGTGLGLYISREIARRHGGDLVLVPGRGAGATFTLSLPSAP